MRPQHLPSAPASRPEGERRASVRRSAERADNAAGRRASSCCILRRRGQPCHLRVQGRSRIRCVVAFPRQPVAQRWSPTGSCPACGPLTLIAGRRPARRGIRRAKGRPLDMVASSVSDLSSSQRDPGCTTQKRLCLHGKPRDRARNTRTKGWPRRRAGGPKARQSLTMACTLGIDPTGSHASFLVHAMACLPGCAFSFSQGARGPKVV